jgi:hypothetical protein
LRRLHAMTTIPGPAIQPEKTALSPLNTILPGWEQLPAERQRELVMSLAAMVVKRLDTAQLPQAVSDD